MANFERIWATKLVNTLFGHAGPERHSNDATSIASTTLTYLLTNLPEGAGVTQSAICLNLRMADLLSCHTSSISIRPRYPGLRSLRPRRGLLAACVPLPKTDIFYHNSRSWAFSWAVGYLNTTIYSLSREGITGTRSSPSGHKIWDSSNQKLTLTFSGRLYCCCSEWW